MCPDDNALGFSSGGAAGNDGYTVIHTATTEDDDFAGTVSTSFTTFDPNYQYYVDQQSGEYDDDDEGMQRNIRGCIIQELYFWKQNGGYMFNLGHWAIFPDADILSWNFLSDSLVDAVALSSSRCI